jgi:hypothetical protein
MITLFSEGDYDFVMRGGPWIFQKHALVVKDFAVASRPSEAVFDSVPIWVRIYDVPWDKQNKKWGMRYGNGLGKAVEVDVPSDVQDMNEFLRVRVEIPYNRRIQPQLSTGVKGKPGSTMVFKLKYERIPHYCEHCGFMGHKKDDCEKKLRGTPSLDYEAYQLRCSPFKKFEHRAHFVPASSQANAKRGLSFGSFGSAESRKSAWTGRDQNPRQPFQQMRRDRSASPDGTDDMPPLEDDLPAYDDGLVPVGAHDGFDDNEELRMEEVDQNLLPKVDTMQMGSTLDHRHATSIGREKEPIVQFPEEDELQSKEEKDDHVKFMVNKQILGNVMQAMSYGSGSRSGSRGPHSS